jgi:hypothetical protein
VQHDRLNCVIFVRRADHQRPFVPPVLAEAGRCASATINRIQDETDGRIGRYVCPNQIRYLLIVLLVYSIKTSLILMGGDAQVSNRPAGRG